LRLTPFGVERWFDAHEARARYNIAESCARPLGLDELLRIAGAAPRPNTRLGYQPSAGRADLRASIAALYPGASADDVLVTVGAIEANFLALSALAAPGDRVIALVPTYQQLYEVPRAQGARVDFWQLGLEDAWRPDLDALRRLLREPASLVVVNFPNNPTGVAVDRSFLADLAGLCRERGALLYSDEVYRGLRLRGEIGQPSAWEVAPGECVVVGSLSKAYGLPGLRIGWLLAPPDVRRRAHEIREYTSISSSAISEELALLALGARERIISLQREHALANLRLVEDCLAASDGRLSWTSPDEGVVGFVRYRASLPSRELGRRLVDEASTLVVPGECFGVEGHFRLGFGYETPTLAAGLDRLSHLVAALD